MKPSELYKQLILQPNFLEDAAQKEVLKYFDHLQTALLEEKRSLSTLWIKHLKRLLHLPVNPIRGIYLWGGVGRGKTVLMDLFFESLPFEDKKRMHFHRFMMYVHEALKDLQGQRNPLKKLAKAFAQETKILCFDEFYVVDIADAMLLGNLLHELFDCGVTLVATSNLPPKDLYLNGLQRDKFKPAITFIEKHTQVISLNEGEDFRMRTLAKAEIYHYPLDFQASKNLESYFHGLTVGQGIQDALISLDSRQVRTKWLGESIVWFDFETLCLGYHAAKDYIELSKLFHTVILSDVLCMDESKEDAARRFIALVDEFYERHVILIISAQVPIEQLYQGRLLKFEFERTKSRLQEMQTHEYLSKPHLA